MLKSDFLQGFLLSSCLYNLCNFLCLCNHTTSVNCPGGHYKYHRCAGVITKRNINFFYSFWNIKLQLKLVLGRIKDSYSNQPCACSERLVPWEFEPVPELFIALLPLKDPKGPHKTHHFKL